MTVEAQQQPVQPEAPKSDADRNFAAIRNALDKKNQEVSDLVKKNDDLQKQLAQILKRESQSDSDSDDFYDEPYVDTKKLKKELKRVETGTSSLVEEKIQQAIEQDRRDRWLEENGDFEDIMGLAQNLYEKAPTLAKQILKMPEGFERNKLVYENIKALGLHRKEEPRSSIQDVINKNRKGAFYTPTDVSAPPYQAYSVGKDYSPEEMKNAYLQQQQKAKNIRL